MNWKKGIILIGLGIVVYLGMQYVLPVTIPFFLGWFLAVTVLPPAVWMEKKSGISRGITGGILIFGIVAVTGVLVWYLLKRLFGELDEIIYHVSVWVGDTENLMRKSCCFIEKYTGIEAGKIEGLIVTGIENVKRDFSRDMGKLCARYGAVIFKSAGTVVAGLLTSVIFGTLIVKELEPLKARFNENNFMRKIKDFWGKICEAGGKYLKTQMILMGIISAVCAAGFALLKNPYFLAAGIAVGALDMLPILGTGTILIPWSLLWCVKGKYLTALGYLLLYAVTYVVREFLEPRLLGKEIGIHPALMVVAVYVGFYVYGFWGFFLGPATLLILRIGIDEINSIYPKIHKEVTKKP